MMRGMYFMPGMGLGQHQHGPMEFVATVDHDTSLGLGFVPTEADYRYMACLHRERVRTRLTSTPLDYHVCPYRMSLADYFATGPEVHPHMGDSSTVTDLERMDELHHQFHHLQLGDETSGAPVLVMIASSSPGQASFLSLSFPDETTNYGVDFEPTRVTDGVIPLYGYRDEMDMSMSQIVEVVKPESASPFDLFGMSAIEVAEKTQTVLAPKLMKDVIVGDVEFEDTFGFIKGASDFMDPPLSFDILSGFISCSDNVYDSLSMDLSIFEYFPVSYDSIYISAPYSLTPQILDIDDEIMQPDADRDFSDHDSDPIDKRVSPAIGDVETIDFGIEDHPKELKIGSPLSTDERDRLIHLLRSYLDVFAWSYEDMPGLDPSIV